MSPMGPEQGKHTASGHAFQIFLREDLESLAIPRHSDASQFHNVTRNGSDVGNKLFVGGLAWGTGDEGLADAFSRFGEIVEAKVITDRETGRSRGFGFVTFVDDSASAEAMGEMDGQELDGRTIRVNEANDRGPRGGGGGGGGHRGGGGGHRGGGGGGGGRW